MSEKKSSGLTFSDEEADIRAAFETLFQDKEPPKLDFNPETIEQDIGRLVLALVELIRQLMEAQAVRRFENGTLSEEEEELLGTALLRAKEAVQKIAGEFGLSQADLNLTLSSLRQSQ